MRKYNKNTNELEAAVCNCCGKSMKIQNGMLLEGICSVSARAVRVLFPEGPGSMSLIWRGVLRSDYDNGLRFRRKFSEDYGRV
ncbi:MAG: hypothetical protein ACLSH1_09120 [Clostridia bacterium]